MFIDGMSEYIWVIGSARNIDLLENQGWYIYFSEEPGDYGDEHWDNPHILFEPGEGGQLEDYPLPPVFKEEPDMFAGLFVYRSHRGRFAVNWADYSEVYFRFDPPNVHGATSYTLEYSDDDRKTWQPYIRNDEILVTDNNNIVLIRVDGEYWYRLKLNDGPYEGYTSNEVFAELSNVHSQFAGWSSDDNLYDDEPYIGRKNIIIRTTIRNESYEISDEYLTYQWYRVNPVTFEMEELEGETDNRYYLTSADVGYDHILRANGDSENIGGFQQFLFKNSSQYAKDKNPAYISEIALDKVRLNLYYETLEPLNPGDFYLVAYDSEYNEIIIEVNDVINIENNSVYDIMVDLLEDLSEIYLNINSDFWELQKFGDYHHWIGGISIYKLPDL